MFHDMVAEYDIKGVGFKRDLVYIHFHLGQRGFNVSGDVFEVFHGFHPIDKAKLWRDMKHFQVGGEEVRLLLQKKPHQPMPFQSEAIWAKCIVPALSAIGQKLSERMVTYIAGHLISPIKQSHNPQKKM